MAAYDEFVTQNASSKLADVDVAARFCGAPVKKVAFSFERDGGNGSGSIWRIARISPFAKILSFKFACDAMSGMTDLDVGFYKPLEVGGTAIDADCIKDGLDPHAGQTALVELYVKATGIDEVGMEAWQLAGISAANAKKYGAFDVALTGNTAGATSGTMAGVLEYIE